MSDKEQEMKYEGLTALIVTLDKNHEERMVDFKEFIDQRFTGLEQHNKKQNGSISTALKKIGELEGEANERKLTCGAAVKVLQKEVKYTKLVLWIDQHWKLSVAVFVGVLLVTQGVVHAAVAGGWLSKIFDIVKGI